MTVPALVVYQRYNLRTCIERQVSCPGFCWKYFLTKCWGFARECCSTINILFAQSIFELVHCNACFFSFRWMWWWGCRQLKKSSRIPTWGLFALCSFAHWQPYISQIMKDCRIIRISFNIYICLNHCWWCEITKVEYGEKPRDQR